MARMAFTRTPRRLLTSTPTGHQVMHHYASCPDCNTRKLVQAGTNVCANINCRASFEVEMPGQRPPARNPHPAPQARCGVCEGWGSGGSVSNSGNCQSRAISSGAWAIARIWRILINSCLHGLSRTNTGRAILLDAVIAHCTKQAQHHTDFIEVGSGEDAGSVEIRVLPPTTGPSTDSSRRYHPQVPVRVCQDQTFIYRSQLLE